MKKIWIVTKNELYRYFISPLAYVYLLSFLILNSSFAIYFGDFFNRGNANLLSMFSFHPWLYLLFLPGISMRLWAEEFRSKTIVQIATLPVSISSLVWGKFFASWLFCGIALLLSFPFWITVNILGDPENKIIILSYIASFTLAGCMLAISQTMSALTKNQVIALVLAVIANLIFFWSGIEYILSTLRLFLPDMFIDVISSFSFLSHFNTLSKGLLELRDVLFFISIILFFNFTTIFIVNFKTAGTSGWLKSTSREYFIVAWIMLLVILLSINILANNLTRNIQYDATNDKIFTLSSSTKYVLKNLPEPIVVKLYFSPILGQRNSNLRETFDNIRILLQKYKNVAEKNFDYKVYYPNFLSEDEDIALANGVQAIPLIDLNQNALFGMTIEDSLQNKQVIPFFAHENQGAIEQELTSKIRSLYHKKKTIGVLTGLPIFGKLENDASIITESWKIVDLLRENYEIINIVNTSDFDRNIDVLIIFFPQNITNDFINKIKQFSMNNGNILLLMDPANEASRLYSLKNKNLENSNIGELEQFWGIKFFNQYVVADLKNSIMVDATTNYQTNPIFAQDIIQFKVSGEDMNPLHPVTKNLKEMMFASASVFSPLAEAFESGKIKFYPLLKASSLSSIMTRKVVTDGLNPQQILKYFQTDDNQKFIAANIQGTESDKQFNLIVVGDTDFIYDSFWMNKKMMLENEYIMNQNDNANFILNAVDYLAKDDDLISLRGKRMKSRKFDDIETMRKILSLDFKKNEEDIFEKMNKAKLSIQEVWNKKNFEERDNFTADELALISNVRTELNDLREMLGNLRNNAFKTINRVSMLISFFNIWLIPIIFGLVILSKTIIKIIRSNNFYCNFKFDKTLGKLFILCLTIFVLSTISIYFTNRSNIDSFEKKIAFPNVMKNINKIDKIELKTNMSSLIFVKQNGEWILENFSNLPVYQERIRRLITTIADAKFFEKKSNKAENLEIFNLLPIEDKKSKVTHIKLKNGEKLIQSFDLGDINIDLGRGAKAAYIKFENKFQVWKIIADFIDMDLDWHKWTYSNLWDLRYGRLIASNDDEKAEKRAVILMRNLLNTPIINVIDNTSNLKLLNSLNLIIEDESNINIDFYEADNKYFAKFNFVKISSNEHLNFIAKYLSNKLLEIEKDKLEKIFEQYEL